MNKFKHRGFTLIELLVVIAIIAILAAILFPVFAQAKRAAKGAVAVSSAKQMALAQIMYTNDYDDMFTPVLSNNTPLSNDLFPWSYLQQPYMKNWGILQDPTGPSVLTNSADSQGGYNAFALYGMWGMPPERIASAGATQASNFTFGQQTLGAAMTGGQKWYYDGIAGVAINGHVDWPDADYNLGGVPSLTTTAIANPADQVMIAQSGTWDFMWENNGNSYGDYGTSNDTPDNFDLYFSGCGSNTYGCKAVICGPIARQRDSDGNSVGFFTFPGAQPSTQTLPTGLSVWAGTDGHVKATPWRSLMGTTVPANGGANLAIKAFWPSGS